MKLMTSKLFILVLITIGLMGCGNTQPNPIFAETNRAAQGDIKHYKHLGKVISISNNDTATKQEYTTIYDHTIRKPDGYTVSSNEGDEIMSSYTITNDLDTVIVVRVKTSENVTKSNAYTLAEYVCANLIEEDISDATTPTTTREFVTMDVTTVNNTLCHMYSSGLITYLIYGEATSEALDIINTDFIYEPIQDTTVVLPPNYTGLQAGYYYTADDIGVGTYVAYPMKEQAMLQLYDENWNLVTQYYLELNSKYYASTIKLEIKPKYTLYVGDNLALEKV